MSDRDRSPGSNGADPIELEFWRSVESSGEHNEYRAYLKQYPNGDFTALAKARLAKPSPPKPNALANQEVELEFWNSIKDGDVAPIFEAYLKKYPNGEFKTLAELRLVELSGRKNERRKK